jgi:hypothetical protein
MPASKVDVCALLTGLSPMRKKHFIGELVDEQKSMRFVGFSPAQRAQLDSFNSNHQPVLLKNCDIQLNEYSKNLEVVIKGYTKITNSPKKFDVEDPATIGTTTISLNELDGMEEFAKVNIHAKVIELSTPQIVNGGKRKQEVVLGDDTGTATLTLWETDIDCLQLSKSYDITKLIVRIFRDTHFLSLPITGGMITEIEDISGVSDAITGKIELMLYNAKVCGVKQLDTYKLCLACDGKVITLPGENMASCQKCHMKQKASNCEDKLMAKMLINGHADEDTSELTFTTLVAFGDILKVITGTDEIDDEVLLNAKPFTARYTQYYTLSSISRD